MDEVKRANMKDYWKRGANGDEFVRSQLSRDRFLAIYLSIRLYDPKEFENGKAKSPLYKAQEYLDLLVLGFQKVHLPDNRYLSLDEEMTKFLVITLVNAPFDDVSVEHFLGKVWHALHHEK